MLTRESAHFLGELPRFFKFAAKGLHRHGEHQPVGQYYVMLKFFRKSESLRETAPALIEPPR
jgi:hypothetical protein